MTPATFAADETRKNLEAQPCDGSAALVPRCLCLRRCFACGDRATPSCIWRARRRGYPDFAGIRGGAFLDGPNGGVARWFRRERRATGCVLQAEIPASSNAQTPALEVVAAESTLTETRLPLPKAADFPLPVPVFVHQEAAASSPGTRCDSESMRDSAPIAPPVVETVNPAQMMPVSAPQLQPATQQFSEPVAVSEEAARALLVHTVNPVYPPEALAQKLHGPVVLQAVIGRDGNVEDLKIVRGYFVLGRAAIAAVKQWRFQPYSLNGQAAATQTVITINFSYPPG